MTPTASAPPVTFLTVILLFGSILSLLGSPTTPEESAVKTPAFARIFRDHAVLQRGQKLPVWGFAPPGQQLTVRFGDQSVETVADPSGAWQIELEPLEASFEPERLILTNASGETLQVVEDLLVGEVWVLGGQSNMAWWLKSSDGGEAAATQANYPWLRVFDPGWQLPDEPASDAASGAKWTVCTPQTAGSTSAIGFWFAEALHHHFEVPVGLVQTAVSGTYGESWVPREVLESIPEAQPRLDEYQAALEVLPEETARWEAEKAIHDAEVAAALEAGTVPPQPSFFVRHGPMGPNHYHRPYALFNGRIAPVAPFAARGVVWYQGEGNTQKPRAPYYDDILRGLLTSWRNAWSTPELPFIIVQLPRFVPGIHNDWPMVREKQFEVAQEDPHTGLVTTIDLGDPNDIHPRDKKPVAERVTRLALSLAYGQSGVATGPLLESVSQRGESFQLTFSQTGEGLRLSAGDTVKGFVFETETGATLSAEARLTGPDTVTLTAPESGATPVRIRYAAENLPDINLINSAGLPAAPFRYELSFAEAIISIDTETGNAVLTFALKAGQNYLVQSSEDLATWNTWSLNVPAGGFDQELKVTDDGTYTNPHPKMTGRRFYRLIEQEGPITLKYGTHERNSLDLWSASGEGPHPLLIYIHGGGWSAGDKTQIDGRVNIDTWLAKGVSVASINYRYSTDGILPLPVHDAVRAVQFLKYYAEGLKLNSDRFALQGGSAGGCSALYILFHDDLADPSASDPVLRESTRVAGVFGQFPQTSIHPNTLNQWIGVEAASHPMIYNAVGAASYAELTNNIDAYEALLVEFSPINHMDADDPPLYLSYPSDMTLPAATPAAAIHHGMFGVKLKEQADRIGYTKLWLSIPGTEDAAITSTTFLETVLLGQ